MTDSTISQATEVDRRQFLKATGGILLAMTFPAASHRALAAGIDPLLFRQNRLATSTDPLAARTLAVLNAAATLGGWSTAVPAGRARGIAISLAFNTIVAEVAEISVTLTAGVVTNFKVHKVACVVDCGTAVNPNSVEAQMQGGIFHGLSAAKWGELKWTAGVSSVKNFNKFRMTRMKEAPVITVQIINSGAPMSGCGEPGVPPIAPAIANAIAKLTGQRFRNLPFFPGATMGDKNFGAMKTNAFAGKASDGFPGSARVSRAGEGVPPSRTSLPRRLLIRSRNLWRTGREVRFGGTPKPARETRALPGKSAATFSLR